jgi:hypothetical protein
VNGRKKKQDWFDAECKNMQKRVRKLLKTYRKSLSADDRFSYCKTRREYKNMLLCKQKKYNASVVDSLISSINNQQDFWETVHNILPKRNCVRNQISVEEWFEHFKRLLEQENVQDGFEDDGEDVMNDKNVDAVFNRPISLEEVLLALRKLKCKKAAGPDGVVGEFFEKCFYFCCAIFCSFLQCAF